MSQFLLYIFTVFVKNLVLSVQVRGSPYSKVISPKDPNTTSERACSLEFRNSGNIGPCLFYELRTNYQLSGKGDQFSLHMGPNPACHVRQGLKSSENSTFHTRYPTFTAQLGPSCEYCISQSLGHCSSNGPNYIKNGPNGVEYSSKHLPLVASTRVTFAFKSTNIHMHSSSDK